MFYYFKKIADLALIFSGRVSAVLNYSDIDYAGDRPDIHYLISGYSFSLNNSVIN